MFEVSSAKKQILERLVEQDWTPTELSEQLDKSRNTVYNHLEDLHDQGLLTKEKVKAKTRPMTKYSLEQGFLQYVTVMPGQYEEKSMTLSRRKEALLRIWNIPQEEFHPYIEDYWGNIRNHVDLNYPEGIEALAVYGSVARGQADKDSDIDFLVITEDEELKETVEEMMGSLIIRTEQGSKIGVAEVYSVEEYQETVYQGSKFLKNIQEELHVVYDPNGILQKSKVAMLDEN